ncbi:adenosine deaminase-like protein isoform X2 [Diorhabda sublineata]|uniref:adenosine deaminase-like protein isoform X2 n=1 Tax=Diorhabda sublineata TaxID=1163346 RepID=UPI0024E17CF6|nr:adenosine deaminase-like protein isoform X2 [Diorhabda sublineata]XP_056636405.1 adenosine deaminase-like protein isoform X2 [Diorhabda sublineata]
MSSNNSSNLCRILPKVELHAHLNGSLNPEILKDLSCNDNAISEYQKFSNITDKTTCTLDECFKLFDIAYQATKTKENVYLATKSVIKDFDTENTVYLELRTTPRKEQNMTKEEYVEAVIRAIENCKDICNVLVKLILSINRRHDKLDSKDTLNVIIKMKNKYPDIIKGVDLSGDPRAGIFDEELFEKVRKLDLKTAIHCAEVKNDEEVGKILDFQPDRIGHAIFLHPAYGGSKINWEKYCEKKIPVECCLTSNVITTSMGGYQNHHLREWIDSNLPFSINTDDRGVFGTTLSKEYEYALNHFKLMPLQLWDISFNAMEHSFATEIEKSMIQKGLIEWKVQNLEKFNLIN